MISKIEEMQLLENLIFQLPAKEKNGPKNIARPDEEFTRCICNCGIFLIHSYFTL